MKKLAARLWSLVALMTLAVPVLRVSAQSFTHEAFIMDPDPVAIAQDASSAAVDPSGGIHAVM